MIRITHIDQPRTLEEDAIHERITLLRREYEAAVRPLIDRLAAINNTKIRQYYVFDDNILKQPLDVKSGKL